MKKHIKEIMYVVFGWVFIILGIAGLFLPILQGILFLLIGLFLLSRKSPWARKFLIKIKYRYPVLYWKAHEGRLKISRFLAKLLRKR